MLFLNVMYPALGALFLLYRFLSYPSCVVTSFIKRKESSVFNTVFIVPLYPASTLPNLDFHSRSLNAEYSVQSTVFIKPFWHSVPPKRKETSIYNTVFIVPLSCFSSTGLS